MDEMITCIGTHISPFFDADQTMRYPMAIRKELSNVVLISDSHAVTLDKLEDLTDALKNARRKNAQGFEAAYVRYPQFGKPILQAADAVAACLSRTRATVDHFQKFVLDLGEVDPPTDATVVALVATVQSFSTFYHELGQEVLDSIANVQAPVECEDPTTTLVQLCVALFQQRVTALSIYIVSAARDELTKWSAAALASENQVCPELGALSTIECAAKLVAMEVLFGVNAESYRKANYF